MPSVSSLNAFARAPDGDRRRLLPTRASFSFATRRPGAPDFLEEKRHGDIGLAHQVDIGRRQALVVHAPAAVDMRVERDVDHLRADRRIAPPAFSVPAVSIQSSARTTSASRSIRRPRRTSPEAPRAADGRWETPRRLDVGEDARLQLLGERDARFPAGFAAAHSPDEDAGDLRSKGGSAPPIESLRRRKNRRRPETAPRPATAEASRSSLPAARRRG